MSDPCAGSGWQRATAPWRRAWALAGRPCALCGQCIDYARRWPDRRALTVDHIVPRWKGGAPLDPANWRPAHASCNSKRGAIEGNALRKRRDSAPRRTPLTW